MMQSPTLPKPNLRVEIYEGTKENDIFVFSPTGNESSKPSPRTPPRRRRSRSPSSSLQSSPMSPFEKETFDNLRSPVPRSPSRKNVRMTMTCPKMELSFPPFESSLETPTIKRRTSTVPWTCDVNVSDIPKRRAQPRSLAHDFSLSGIFRTPTSNSKVNLSSSSKKKGVKFDYSDRFIPSRQQQNRNLQLHNISNENDNSCTKCTAVCIASSCTNHDSSTFKKKLAESLLESDGVRSKVLNFGSILKTPKDHNKSTHHDSLRELFTANKELGNKSTTSRYLNKAPERVLDAPELVDDYYLNLLHWSSQNVLGVGLGTCVFAWNSTSGSIDCVVDTEDSDNIITAVRWSASGQQLSVGLNNKTVELWDVEKRSKIRTFKGHSGRVSALSWNEDLLSSGSRDASIINHDIRASQSTVAILHGHQEEICGLAWSPDGMQLASGANDNLCCIWEQRSANTAPRFTFDQHVAAVKALAWCPFQRNLLATGGGTADRHIRFFNTQQGTQVNSVDTRSQVCSIQWSLTEKELISAHGFSENQLTLWKYPSLTPIATLTGHTSRVLHTALSPDGSTVCSAAGDETLRFWNVWEAKQNSTRRQPASILSSQIR